MDDVVALLTFKMERRESVNGRDAIVIAFSPRPDADPETREGRIAKAFTGNVWVDEAAREVMRVEATAVDTISFGFGLIARLNEGEYGSGNRLGRARGDDHLLARQVQSLPPSIEGADRIAQFGQAGAGRILVRLLRQRPRGGGDQFRRSLLIRKALPQVDRPHLPREA